MGTDRFREDVSEALKKFKRAHLDQTPQVLKVNRQEAMVWYAAENGGLSTEDFVTHQVQSYVDTIPWQKSKLRCGIELLDVDDASPTRFE
jgi:hypothetical protein